MAIPTTQPALDELAKDLCRIMELGDAERDNGGWSERVIANQADYENRSPDISIPFLKGWQVRHFPLSQPKLDQLCAIILTTIFAQDPVFMAGLSGATSEQSSRLQRQMQFFIEDHLEEVVGILAPIVCYAGIGILAIDFDAVALGQVAITPPGRVPSAGPIAYAGPVYRAVHPLDFGIWPASISDIRSCQACWHKLYKQERDIRALQKIGRYLKDDRPLLTGDHPGQDGDASKDYDEWGRQVKVDSDKPSENPVQLRSILFRRDFGEGEAWHVATIALRNKRILRLKAYNRSRPGYVDLRLMPAEYGCFWPSRSIGSDLSALQYLNSYILNILAAGGAMSAFPVVATDGAADKVQNWMPNTAIKIPGASSTQMLASGFNPAALLQLLGEVQREADAVTRITQEQTGVAIAKEQTKAEFAGRQAGAAPGLTKFIQTLGRGLSEVAQITQELLEKNYSLWSVAYPQQTFVRDILDLKAPCKWDVQGKTADDIPAIRLQKIQQAYTLAAQSSQRRLMLRQMPLFNMDALELAFMNNLGLPNIGEIIIDQPTGMGPILPQPGVPPIGGNPAGTPVQSALPAPQGPL